MSEDSAFQQVIDICGLEVAEEMVLLLGGLHVRYSGGAFDQNSDFGVLAEATYDKLAAALFPGEKLYVPIYGNDQMRNLRRKAAVQLYDEGHSINVIARRFHVSGRSIYKWLEAEKHTSRRQPQSLSENTKKLIGYAGS